MAAMRGMMEQLKLTVNDDKTHLCQIPQERFDFLGYTFGRCYSQKTGRAYIGTRPSPKSVKRMVENITQETDRRRTILDAEVVVGRLNRKLIGWANYFLPGSSQSGLSSHRLPRHATAPPVVMQETQGSRHRVGALPEPVPLREVGAGQFAGEDP